MAATGGGVLLALAIAAEAASHPVGQGTTSAEATRLRTQLADASRLTARRLRPGAELLARDLPAEAAGLERLREPASTTEGQLAVALSELERMSALTYDPHYLPALLAVGRAFLAVSGQDPITRTTINPEYLGLERELAVGAEDLEDAGGTAAAVARSARRLGRSLVRLRRRAQRLEARIERLRQRDARG
jgi:hypothetical protein